MPARAIARQPLTAFSWLLFVAISVIIAWNSRGYFQAPEQTVFFEEKAAAAAHLSWRLALYAHVAAGIVCLAASGLQFFRSVIRRFPALHRWMGRVYAVAVLSVLCPSGCWLALFAKGGFAGQTGFLLLSALTFHTTWRGVVEMRAGRVRGHARWMIRSFALVVSALTFRLWHVAFDQAGWDYETNYVCSLWLSITGNAAVAEWIARKIPISPQYKKTMHPAVLRGAGDSLRPPLCAGVTHHEAATG